MNTRKPPNLYWYLGIAPASFGPFPYPLFTPSLHTYYRCWKCQLFVSVWEPGKDSRTDICKMWFDHWLWKSIEALLIFTHGCKIGSRHTVWRYWENQSVGALIKGGEWDFVFTTKTNDPLLENPSHVRQLALLSQVPTMNIGANFLSQPSGKSVTPLSLLRRNSAL